MSDNRLNIVSSDNTPSAPRNSKETNRIEAEAKYERIWLVDSKQFDPFRNVMERERVDRTWALLKEFWNTNPTLAVDLGSGWGEISKRLANAGAQVHAVDIATLALKRLENIPNIQTYKQFVPLTKLIDEVYDIVVATDIIAFLPAKDYRLFISEMARLVKPNGLVVCSTPIDINSEDALYRFNELAETDFKIEKWRFGYHRLWIRFHDFFDAPRRLVKAGKDREYRERELKMRTSLDNWWFNINSSVALSWMWGLIQYVSNPIAKFISNNRWLLLNMEKLCKVLWDEDGISHAIFVGKRRPLVETPPKDIPIERKGKRQVWE